MINFAVIPKDNRQKFLNNYLNKSGYNSVLKYNFDFNKRDIIIGATPFLKDNKYLNCEIYSSFPVDTFLNLLKKGQYVFSCNIPESIVDRMEKKNIHLIDLNKNVGFLWKNARLTAEGLIEKIIKHTSISICNSKILLLGFGKCGECICSLLNGFNCDIYVYDCDITKLEKAKAFGYNYLFLNEFNHLLNSFDIIINTVPSEIFTTDNIKNINKNCELFEIASYPYGLNKKIIEDNSLSINTCPGLPGASSPKTAGEVIAKHIISYLERIEINDT